MKLTKDEIESLKSFKNHPWYKILEKIENKASIDLWNLLLSWDLTDEKILDVIKKNQVYHKARKDFFENVESHIKEIYNPNI